VTELGDASAVPVLVQLIGGCGPRDFQAAQENLAALPGPEANAAVVTLFNSGDPATSRPTLAVTERGVMYGDGDDHGPSLRSA